MPSTCIPLLRPIQFYFFLFPRIRKQVKLLMPTTWFDQPRARRQRHLGLERLKLYDIRDE
jgi:hypothetical protein